MTKTLTHASFFSGVGGLDLGFERAGIRTVSVSEIDPFARSILASRFPGVPQLGDIVALADHELSGVVQQPADALQRRGGPADSEGGTTSSVDWRNADIWSGGFPCQDLSVAGKRKGFTDGERSVLAFTFLNLVERFRPRWLVLENVPGLLSSNNGRDLARLLREMDELGYGVSWRTLDARYFGVPQRRRRVFLVASLGSDRSAEVLFECEGGCGHSVSRRTSWQDSSGASDERPHVAGALLARYHKGPTSTVEDGQLVVTTALTRGGLGGGFGPDDNDAQGNKLVISPKALTDGVRAADGVAGGLDNSSARAMGAAVPSKEEVEQHAYSIREDAKAGNFSATPIDTALSLNAVWPSPQSHHAQTFIAAAYRKSSRVSTPGSPETWVDDGVANTLNTFDTTDIRTTHAVVGSFSQANDELNPEGMDSNRYKVCGNGVVSNVAEWIGVRLAEVDARS